MESLCSLLFHKTAVLVVLFAFLTNTILPVTYAQSVFNLPAVGTIITFSPPFIPPLVRGITLYPDNPLKFDFIVDVGDDHLQGEAFQKESMKLIKYFLVSLTVPENDMWVNLSPYEKERIVPEHFGKTEMGRDLLLQDYILKQLTAGLMNPDQKVGAEFWNRVRQKAKEKFGMTDIPMDTFNKVWIVPDKAQVYVKGQNVYVVDSHLKVMLEEDYLARENSVIKGEKNSTEDNKETSQMTKELIREIIIPEIEKEVNEGKNFALLRQIQNSAILAAWYKKNLKQTLLGKVYVDQKKTDGINSDDKEAAQKIYNQYLEAFKKGAYNFIKEDYDPSTQEVIPRKYFSGGVNELISPIVTIAAPTSQDFAQLSDRVASKVALELQNVNSLTPSESQSDAAMVAQSKENKLTGIIRENIIGNVAITLNDLAVEAGFDDPHNKIFQRALLKYLQTIPKTILHEHVSGVIFPEDLIRYFLDDEPSTEEFTANEHQKRLEARREARRRFVLTINSQRSGIDLQANPVNPNDISQEEADRAFREILELPKKVSLTLKDINLPDTVKKIKMFVTYKDQNIDWNKFERTFAVIKTVTDSHLRFRYELLREGVLRHFNQDNVRNLELTDFHSQSLGELLKELVSIERQLHGEMRLSVLKAFRKDYLDRILKRAEEDANYRQEVFKRYQGQSFDEVKENILKETLEMDQQYFKLDQEKVKKEFEEAIEQIKENLKIEKKEQVTLEDIRNRLIFAFEARKLALKEAKDFEADLNRLELKEPLLRKRIAGISSIGMETGYINWIGSPILRNARRIGLKISSHMGEIWEPSQYAMSLKRIKHEIEIGFNRLSHVTVLGLDYGPSTRIPISEPERIEAQKLQEEIFSLIRRNRIHVELQPTSQIITSADFNDYKDHIISKFFKLNGNGSGLSFSINPDDSSIFDISPSQEELAIWLANPDLPYSVFSQTRRMASDAEFYEPSGRVKKRLRIERRKIWTAIRDFNKPIKRPAIVVIGSARIPDGGQQEMIGRKIGELAWENNTAIRTGAGPAAMKWPLAEFIRYREEHFSDLRKRGLAIPEKFPVQSINVLVNSFEPDNEYLEQNYNFRHFVYRKLGLHLNALGLIGIHGGLGTWDEIFEGWRRRRQISLIGQSYYQPILNVLKDRWAFAGLLNRVDEWPFVTDSSEEAFHHILDHAEKQNVLIPTKKQTEEAIKEMENGIDKLSALPRAVVILGKPEDNEYGRKVLEELNDIISPILKTQVPVRITSRGIILGSVLEQAQRLHAESALQAVLYKKEEEVEELNPSEQYVKTNLPEKSLFLEDDSNHQLLLTYDARGYIVLPGGIGTFNKLFDLVVAMQTNSIRRKPIVLVGREFWEPILKILKQTMEDYEPPLVSKGDFELMTIVDTPQEAIEELALNGIGENVDAAMMGTQNKEKLDRIIKSLKEKNFNVAKDGMTTYLNQFITEEEHVGVDHLELLDFFKTLINYIESQKVSLEELNFLEEYMSKLGNLGELLQINAAVEILLAIIKSHKSPEFEGVYYLKAIKALNDFLDNKFISGSQRKEITKIEDELNINPRSSQPELLKIFLEIKELILLEDGELLPSTRRQIYLDVSSDAQTALLDQLKIDMPGSNFLKDRQGKVLLYQFDRDAAVTQPFLGYIIHKSGIPLRMVIKDKTKKQSVDFFSHLGGTKLLASINAPIAWVFEGKKYIYIREVKDREITDVMFEDLDRLSVEQQQELFFSLGIAMSEAHILGMTDRARNLIVNERRLNYPNFDDLFSVDKRVVFNIDRENVLKPGYLEKSPEKDIDEAKNFIVAWANQVLPQQRHIFIDNISFYLEGFKKGYQFTRGYYRSNKEKVARRIMEITRAENNPYGPKVLARLNLEDEQINLLVNNLRAAIELGLSKSPSWSDGDEAMLSQPPALLFRNMVEGSHVASSVQLANGQTLWVGSMPGGQEIRIKIGYRTYRININHGEVKSLDHRLLTDDSISFVKENDVLKLKFLNEEIVLSANNPLIVLNKEFKSLTVSFDPDAKDATVNLRLSYNGSFLSRRGDELTSYKDTYNIFKGFWESDTLLVKAMYFDNLVLPNESSGVLNLTGLGVGSRIIENIHRVDILRNKSSQIYLSGIRNVPSQQAVLNHLRDLKQSPEWRQFLFNTPITTLEYFPWNDIEDQMGEEIYSKFEKTFQSVLRRTPVITPWYQLGYTQIHFKSNGYGKYFDIILSRPEDMGHDQKTPRDAAMIGKIPGGIDLNANEKTLEEQGDKIKFPIPINPSQWQNFQTNGFIPVIINITPPTSLPALLGLEKQNEEQQLSSIQ